MRYRFTARQHLRRAREFERVRKLGRTFQSAPFVFTLYVPDSDEGTQPVRRLGIIASRRVGNSVVRNRCKRIIRELFRTHQHHLPEPCDCVVLVRRKFPDFTFEKLEQTFVQAFEYVTRPRRT